MLKHAGLAETDGITYRLKCLNVAVITVKVSN
jgi:hypothetical protein